MGRFRMPVVKQAFDPHAGADYEGNLAVRDLARELELWLGRCGNALDARRAAGDDERARQLAEVADHIFEQLTTLKDLTTWPRGV